MVNNEWKKTQLGAVMDFKNGLNTEKSNYGNGVKFVNVMDVFKNDILTEDKIIGRINLDPKKIKDNLLEYGDILFNRTSETYDEIAMSAVYLDNKPATFGGFVIRGRPIKETFDPNYSVYAFQSFDFRNQVIKLGQGAVRANIGQKDLAKVNFLIPPIEEQKKIAKILSTWDKAIETVEKLVANSQQQKKALMQHLLTGQKRLLDENGVKFGDEWEKTNLKNLLKEEKARNRDKAITRVLSVTNHSGFVLPENHFSKRVASDEVSNYKVVKKGQFGYNPSRINVGSFARLDDFDSGILSPMYVVFEISTPKLDSDFFNFWMQSHEAKQRINNSTQGSVRDSVGFDAMASFPFKLPTIKEQEKIAQVLTLADREIDLYNQQLDKLKLEKKSLMQQLLTGQKRVIID